MKYTEYTEYTEGTRLKAEKVYRCITPHRRRSFLACGAQIKNAFEVGQRISYAPAAWIEIASELNYLDSFRQAVATVEAARNENGGAAPAEAFGDNWQWLAWDATDAIKEA